MPQQARRRQHHQQQAEAFKHAQHHQHGHAVRQAAQATCRSQQAQAQHHAALRSQAIGQHAKGHAQQHARALHQREQKAGLHQRHAQSLTQRGDGRRQLAHVQRGANAGGDDEWRGAYGGDFRSNTSRTRPCVSTTRAAGPAAGSKANCASTSLT